MARTNGRSLPSVPTCAVTGASGYIGSLAAAAARSAGWRVRSLGRRPAGGDEHEPFALGRGAAAALDGADALVHAAWDFDARSRREIERLDVAGSERLLADARSAGVRQVVFVSTLSAFPGCRSQYGRAKLRVEDDVRAAGGTVVRPGLVWGAEGGSLYAALRRLALRLPVVPVFSSRRLHLAHEDDLTALFAALLERGATGRTIVAAAREALPLAEIFGRIANAGGRRLRTVPVPWWTVWAPLRAAEAVGLRPPFRSDSVVSLVSLDERPFERADVPPVAFRPFRP